MEVGPGISPASPTPSSQTSAPATQLLGCTNHSSSPAASYKSSTQQETEANTSSADSEPRGGFEVMVALTSGFGGGSWVRGCSWRRSCCLPQHLPDINTSAAAAGMPTALLC